MQANVRLVAQQEVEIANLRDEIASAHQSLDAERGKLTKLRKCLDTQDVSFAIGNVTYSRDQVKQELARKLDLVREAEVVLSGKDRLLDNRQKSLAAAMQVLERTRSQKSLLEGQIASLESQHRLIQAASVGSGSRIDTSKLAQTQKLIADIKKQLDVSERVLAHESRFVEPMVIEASIDEKDVTRQADEYLAGKNGDVEKQRLRRGEKVSCTSGVTDQDVRADGRRSVAPDSRAPTPDADPDFSLTGVDVMLILRIRQAEVAAGAGRLDEAFDLATPRRAVPLPPAGAGRDHPHHRGARPPRTRAPDAGRHGAGGGGLRQGGQAGRGGPARRRPARRRPAGRNSSAASAASARRPSPSRRPGVTWKTGRCRSGGRSWRT